ncbi:hypothetical protein [Actinomycetospora termitidis]|uniref:Uncharacterized protein n=1 Tax=Actinomycetospora termitidis TaxID=3053470 RepID=A0ABT7M9A0_9PSEU|nr:hypothetical protein [Actinomycetospora sp. Odt1-22]MDL5157255.1 hypothetical protein [Actinomycetospora sp. Odt1-22]
MSLSVDGLPSRASTLARPRVAESDQRSTRTLVLLVALALGAMAVVALVVPRVPALAQVIGLAPAPAAAPVAPPVTATAVVVATASCLSPDPHDRVTVDVGGVLRAAVLDGCGRSPGFPVAVEVPADGAIVAPLAVAGTGGHGAPTTTDVGGDTVSPLVARLELALAVAAALGAGSLVVTLARRTTPARRPAPARRATRPTRRAAGRSARNAVPAQRTHRRR